MEGANSDRYGSDALGGVILSESMGRVLKVNPAYLKKEIQPGSESGKKAWPKVKDEAKRYPREEREQRKPWINPAFNKSGTHIGAPGVRGAI